ncbi:hypothetical protein AS159_00540 [Thermotoga sp. Ku-13t]|uniref:hypothetical protein n=1 Tax=Thermotoga sp. Ku-13t TaxID=1755813 RepID=UPI0013EAA918|nr:hypothetical protein [Thermotoga sp. Ku-13t]KAF2958243.1 hypothetical protein AS159_00540 [Thermotoga sp. Ku-13t]
MEGFVIETFGKFAKLRTEKGDIVVKVKGQPPEVGKFVRISDQPVLEKFYLAEKVLQLESDSPPLSALEPILRVIRKARFDEDVVFLSRTAQAVEARVGKLDRNFYRSLAKYYETGEDETFGLWLFTLSNPYIFQSVPEKEAPVHVYIDRSRHTFRIDFVKGSKPVVIEGKVWQNQLVLSFSQMFPTDRMEELRERLSRHFSLVRFILGAGIDGLYA